MGEQQVQELGGQDVLRALEGAGARGITQVDFSLPDVIAGGTPITRVAAHIKDLKDAGHRITVNGKRHKCAVYVLEQPVAGGAPPTDDWPDWRQRPSSDPGALC